MATTGASSPLPNSATTKMASSSAGNANMMSKTRLKVASTQPPRHPASRPSVMPKSVERTTTANGPIRLVREP